MTDADFVLILFTSVFGYVELSPVMLKFQIEKYAADALFRKNKFFVESYRNYFIIGALFLAVLSAGLPIAENAAYAVTLSVLYFAAQIFVCISNFKLKCKVPLAMTKRMIRLYMFSFVAFCAAVAAAVSALRQFGFYYTLFAVFSSSAFLPLIAYACLLIGMPFEKLNNLRYVARAEKKLSRRPDLIKIAVTGSYGKTSVKRILCGMLKADFTVLATEGNYNTPAGIAKTVEKLDGCVDVFIAEMGARHKGDIKRLMKIVRPSYGILTGVTSQHLETFGSLENIYSEKLEVIKNLPSGGCGFLNADCFGKIDFDCAADVEVVGEKDAKVAFEYIGTDENGTDFNLIVDGGKYALHTKLLGRHNVYNIALAAAVALKLGVSVGIITEAIKNLEPVENRLCPIRGAVTVIDDSYNSNPDGAREALDVLSRFPRRRIVVTPGLVELGAAEEKENRNLGKTMAKVCDKAVLIGKKRTKPIADGLLENGFDGKEIYRFDTLFDAKEAFFGLFSAGDTVLFLNDLPDNYNE